MVPKAGIFRVFGPSRGNGCSPRMTSIYGDFRALLAFLALAVISLCTPPRTESRTEMPKSRALPAALLFGISLYQMAQEKISVWVLLPAHFYWLKSNHLRLINDFSRDSAGFGCSISPHPHQAPHKSHGLQTIETARILGGGA